MISCARMIVHGVAERLDVEVAAGCAELHQVQARQIAGRVVEEHVLAAGIRCVDAAAGGAGVPVVDRRVVLDAGIAADPGRLRHLAEEVARPDGLDRLAAQHGARLPRAVLLDRPHEGVGHAHGVVRVLEEDAAVGRPRERAVVAGVDQRPGLLLLLRLAADVLHDVGMIDVQDDHLGGAAGLSPALDHAGEGVVSLHEGDRPRGRAAARERLAARAQRKRSSFPIPSPT